MTTAARTPDATRCPDCGAALTGAGRGLTSSCPSCGLLLQGPPAVRLWELDTALLRLEDERGVLLVERRGLLAQLRTADPHPVDAPAVLPTAPAPEWTPQRVQNTLLSLGGLLLAVAAVVFTAVTYERLGAGGRAAVLVTLTVLAAAAAPQALRRGLSATAETVATVALVLGALDVYGLRTLGVGDNLDPLVFAAAGATALAAAAAAYSRVVPVRIAGVAAVALAQLPVALLLAERDSSAATASLWLAALAAADLAVLALLAPRVRDHVVLTLAIASGTASATGLLVARLDPGADSPRAVGVALVAHAAVLVAAGLLARDSTVRQLLWAAPVLVLATAAHDVAGSALSDVQQPLVLGAVALLAVQAAALLPAARRAGPVLGALVVAASGVVLVGGSALSGLLEPLTWAGAPWTLPAGADARDAIGTGDRWTGSVVTTVVLGAAAVTVGAAGLVLDRLRTALAPTAVLVAATAVLLPLGLATSFPVALAMLLALAAALLGGAVAASRGAMSDAASRGAMSDAASRGAMSDAASRGAMSNAASRGVIAIALAGAGAGVALLAAAWSLADRDSTLVVLAVAALLLAAASTRALPLPLPALAAGVAAALAAAELAAAGAAGGLATDQVGGLLLVAVAALLGGGLLLDKDRGSALEIVGAATGLVAAVLAVEDAGWLSWVLAGAGLLALATGLRPDRRPVAAVGGLLLAASSWVRLLDAEITAPEPYVVPLGLVALALGHLRARSVPGTRSWPAYGAGLSLLLVPSLLASFDDDTATRALLVGAAAITVLLVGARARMQAPLLLGGAVIAVDALQLLGPYAAALPRWSTLGAAGTLLVAVGATYEQRRQDVSRLRNAFETLT